MMERMYSNHDRMLTSRDTALQEPGSSSASSGCPVSIVFSSSIFPGGPGLSARIDVKMFRDVIYSIKLPLALG